MFGKCLVPSIARIAQRGAVHFTVICQIGRLRCGQRIRRIEHLDLMLCLQGPIIGPAGRDTVAPRLSGLGGCKAEFLQEFRLGLLGVADGEDLVPGQAVQPADLPADLVAVNEPAFHDVAHAGIAIRVAADFDLIDVEIRFLVTAGPRREVVIEGERLVGNILPCVHLTRDGDELRNVRIGEARPDPSNRVKDLAVGISQDCEPVNIPVIVKVGRVELDRHRASAHVADQLGSLIGDRLCRVGCPCETLVCIHAVQMELEGFVRQFDAVEMLQTLGFQPPYLCLEPGSFVSKEVFAEDQWTACQTHQFGVHAGQFLLQPVRLPGVVLVHDPGHAEIGAQVGGLIVEPLGQILKALT